MMQLRAYLALSLDGYIAARDGGVSWLDPFNDASLGFDEFNGSIDTIVVGRTTFDQSLTWGPWAFRQRTIVLTHRPLDSPADNVESFVGDVRTLRDNLERDGSRQVWLMGGGRALEPFRDHDLVDRWELFVIPVLLGDGIPLFPASDRPLETLALSHSRGHVNGIVELQYRRRE